MRTYCRIIPLLSLCLFLLFCLSRAKAQNRVKITTDTVSIFTEPDPQTARQLDARKGDIFEVVENQGRWIQINLFSGEDRYIRKGAAKTVYYVPSYPSDPSIRSAICNKVRNAQPKASRKAYAKYSDNENKQSAYENFLFDKYLLAIFKEMDIPAAHYAKLIECVNNGMPETPSDF